MSPKIIMTAVKFLGSPEGRKVLTGLKGGNMDMARTLLKGFGAKTIDQSDVDELFGLANNFDTVDDDVAKVKQIMLGDPTDMFIRTGVSVADNLANVIGKNAQAEANRLAASLLAKTRQNTDAQNNAYGFNPIDKTAQGEAEKMLLKGEKTKNVTDAVSNVINDVAGYYEAQDAITKSMQAGKYLEGQLPATFYTMANGIDSRTRNRRK